MDELFVNAVVTIHAPVSKVWEALINPAITRQYMYGCDVLCDWKIGNPVLWKGMANGKEMIFVKGHLLKLEPEKLLQFTAIDPNSDIEDIPANYLTVTYELKPSGNQTTLYVSQGDYSKVAQGQKRYEESKNGGWDMVLSKIKEIVEQQN
ncbi:SRPBCC domain-containing protein [bacterium]|nr:SRPBCC domain-containing protein [bacterium]